MSIVNNFIYATANVLNTILTLYFWVIIIASLLSWVRPDPYNPIVRLLNAVTEPVFYRIRKWLPFTYISGVDLSPLVALLVIMFTKDFFIKTLVGFALMP